MHLIEGFFQTVRMMDSLSRQREALIALGTLAAGLAHELNNPASATARAVDALQETCDTLLGSLADLAESSLTREQFVALDRMRRELSDAPLSIGSLAMVDCEEAISDWLEAGVVNAWRIAPARRRRCRRRLVWRWPRSCPPTPSSQGSIGWPGRCPPDRSFLR